MKRCIVLLVICLIVLSAFPVYAGEDIDSDIDEDELFGDDMIIDDEDADPGAETDEAVEWEDDMVEEIDETELDSGLENLLLKSEAVELGGKFRFTANPSWTWQSSDLSLDYIFDNITEADIVGLTSTLQASLFFDARPDENFRVFGKTDIEALIAEKQQWSASMQELFADFGWKDLVFFRAGKHTLKWGVGYFFSPADILNLTPIDPEDPEAEREGPVSLKTHIPLDIHNLYLYIIAEDIKYPEDITIAPKFEFVTGTLETGIGGYYQINKAPMGMLTFSYPFMSGINIFAEGVVSYGANKLFIEETEEFPGITVVERNDEIFLSGTIGFLILLNQFNTEWESITFAGQYFFNGFGYSDPSLFETHTIGIGILVQNGEISFKDLMQRGMHYAACAISWNEMFDSDISTSLIWTGNLSDGSGRIIPSVIWNIIDYIQVALSFPVAYGGDFDEFTLNPVMFEGEFDEFPIMGGSFGINLEISLGNGKF